MEAPASCHIAAKVGPAERIFRPLISCGLRMQPRLEATAPASQASERTMICTISSRASPLPPGNWCDAFSTVCASAATENTQQVAAAASTAANFLIGLLLILGTFLYFQGTQFCEHCQSLPRCRARNDCDRAA